MAEPVNIKGEMYLLDFECSLDWNFMDYKNKGKAEKETNVQNSIFPCR